MSEFNSLAVIGLTSKLTITAQFHLISWRGNFIETHNFRRILGEKPETPGKLRISIKSLHR